MIMNCTRSWLMIRKQLMQSPANGTPSPGQRQTQKYFSRSLRIRIKPQTAAPPDDERDLFGREEALRMDEEIMDFQWFEFSKPSFTTIQPLWPQSQLGKRWCSAAGSFWDDPQSTPLRATAHTFWMRDWSFLGLRIGLLSGPWYVPNVMLLQCRTRRAERTSSRCSHVFARSLH